MTSSAIPIQAFEQILSALPHTQCTRCGFADCAAYAQAIVSGEAPINQCPPGGTEGIQRLSQITGLSALPLNPANGIEEPRSVAFIDEDWCIGCTLCIKACPVDAIIGGHRQMHTVIESWCTGCELCLPVCPVDCIILENATGDKTGWNAWSAGDADSARDRYAYHSLRSNSSKGKAAESLEKSSISGASLQSGPAESTPGLDAAATAAARKRGAIDAALERSRRQRQALP